MQRIHAALTGREITSDLVAEEILRIETERQDDERRRASFGRLADVARGEYRIIDGMWQTRIHVDVARTGIVFWMDVDEVRPADRRLLADERAEPSALRAIAQRLRSAARIAAEPVRRRCAELDAAAAEVASDQDLVYVKAAVRQIAFTTTVPAAVVAVVEAAHGRALARSVALANMAANPYDIRRIVAFEDGTHAPRRIVAILGPTNSGKTHEAMRMLREAPTGAYLAPLRLMAMENWDRLKQSGVAVDMRTGEETIEVADATHVSATIEMADVETHVSTVVVDEAQLLDDPQRGWAWTRAIFHSRCDVLVVTGSPDCLPILRRIASLTGERIELRKTERRGPLTTMPEPIDLRSLRQGDAVIAFSRTNVLAMKAEISRITNPATGRPFRVATIYGTLGPEVRRAEAQRFSTGDAEILVATDAIGMGLNLPIDRVLFSTLHKYDGRVVRELAPSEMRQIGGRAGRHGQQLGGFVGMLAAAGTSTSPIRQALHSTPDRPDDPRPYIWPTLEQIERGMEALEVETLSKALPAVAAVLRNGPDYRCQIDPATLDLVQTIEQFDLPLADKHDWIGCPMPLRDQENRRVVEEWASLQQLGMPVRAPTVEYQNDVEIDDRRLREIERVVVQAGAYLWLSRRWPSVFEDVDVAVSARRDGNRMIEDALRQRHIHRTCLECSAPIGYHIRHDTCRKCAFG